jgi:dienelactone hydrolase
MPADRSFPTWLAVLTVAAAMPFARQSSGEPDRLRDAPPANRQGVKPHDQIEPELAFDPARDFAGWQEELRRRLRAIMAIPATWQREVPWSRERDAETDEYTIDRVEFLAEPGEMVPGYLLKPKGGESPLPVMICLQGHSPGMHISIGRGKTPSEIALIQGGRDIALQAVAHGWAALAIEQRAFGRRAVKGVSCGDVALRQLLKGRPLTGRRVFDVMRAVDFIGTQPDLDPARVGCLGNSAGGTVSFYAACADPRIRLAVVSCSFGTFEATWLYRPHCACGYLPGLLKVADMPDLAGLIAPRHLIVVAGKEDALARFDGVEQGFRTARRAFTAAGCPDHVALLAAEGGHRFYPKLAWPAIQRVLDEW